MTSELDDIKARASQRRAVHHFERGHLPLPEACHAAEADLDRAIAVAEQRITAYDMDVTAAYNTMEHAEREKKRMEDAALTWSARCEVAIRERDQARALASQLADVVRQTRHEKQHHKRDRCNCNGCTYLAAYEAVSKKWMDEAVRESFNIAEQSDRQEAGD